MDSEVIKKYREAGKIAKEALELGCDLVEAERYLEEVANKIEDYIRSCDAKVAFPVNLSLNSTAAHYSPFRGDKTKFKSGDLVKVDVGAHLDGYIADTAKTIEIGTSKMTSLIEASENALDNVIKNIRPGISTNEIGTIIENTIINSGYKPIYNLTGHGLERYNLHSGLSIPNYNDNSNQILLPNTAIAIEPFATDGKGYVKNSRASNIYLFLESDSYSERIEKETMGLPFAERWIYDWGINKDLIEKSVKNRHIYSYPQLIEKKKGMVSQREHTILILDDSIVVTTK
jgi:methionyl aminopeptidase